MTIIVITITQTIMSLMLTSLDQTVVVNLNESKPVNLWMMSKAPV